MAFITKKKDGTQFVSFGDILSGIKDGRTREKLAAAQFRSAVQVFLRQHFSDEARELAAAAVNLERADEGRYGGLEAAYDGGQNGKGGLIGKFDGVRINRPAGDTPGGVEFGVALRKRGTRQETHGVVRGERAPPAYLDPGNFDAEFRDVSMHAGFAAVQAKLSAYLKQQKEFDDIIIDDASFEEGSGLTIADLGGLGTVHDGRPLRALIRSVAGSRVARFHELAHIAHAAGVLSIDDILGAVTDTAVRERYYDARVKDIPEDAANVRFHYALRAFQQQYFKKEDDLLSWKLKRLGLSRGQTPPQWSKGLIWYYDSLRDSSFEKDAPREQFGKFTDIKHLADHAKRQGMNSLFLMPPGDPATLDPNRDDSPFSLLSMYALDPRSVDWKATGISGKTPDERWQEFERNLPAGFEKIRTEDTLRQYAHVKTLRVLKYNLPGYDPISTSLTSS
jgi:hypothetical protein